MPTQVKNVSKLAVPSGVSNGPYANLIYENSQRTNVPSEYLAGLVHQESGGNPNATRFEPHFYDRYIKDNPTYQNLGQQGYDTKMYASSIGLTQVMGSTAYTRTKDPQVINKLYDPAYNMKMGSDIYAEHYHRYKNPQLAYVAYNGGRGAAEDIFKAAGGDPNAPGYQNAVNYYLNDPTSPYYNRQAVVHSRLYMQKVEKERQIQQATGKLPLTNNQAVYSQQPTVNVPPNQATKADSKSSNSPQTKCSVPEQIKV